MKKLKVIIPVSVFVVFFIFVLACSGNEESIPEKVGEIESEESTSTEAPEESEAQEEEPVVEEENVQEFFEIGDNVDLDGTIVTVKGVEISSGGDFDEPKEGMEYVVVTVHISNNSNDKISYNPFDFQVQNSKGQITDMAFTIVDSDTSLESGELAIGGEVEGTIAFEEPIGDSGLILIYQPSFWFDDRVVKIKLGTDVPETDISSSNESDSVSAVEGEVYSVGDNVDLDGTIVTVKGVEISSGGDFDEPKEGMEYVVVTVHISNNSNDKISYNPFDFQVQNSKGQITDMAFTIVDSDTSLESGELAIGGEVEGTIAFEEPIGDSGLILIYQPSFWFDDRVVKIKLN